MSSSASFITDLSLQLDEGALGNLLNTDDFIWAAVYFSQPVFVSGQPKLRLLIGDDIVSADHDANVSTSNELWFRYKILAGQTDINGISILPNSLILANTSLIQDWQGNPAQLTHAAVSNNGFFVVDTLINVPMIISIGNPFHVVSQVSENSVVIGRADVNSTVFITAGTIFLGTTISGGDGSWRYHLTDDDLALIGEGENKTITAYARDGAGNISSESAPFSFTINTSPAPLPPVIHAIGIKNNIISSKANDSIITGIASFNTDLVSIYYGQTFLGTTPVTNANWSYTLTPANLAILADGPIQLTAKASDSRGLLSDPSDPFSTLVDRKQPRLTSISIVHGDGIQYDRLNAGDRVWIRARFSEDIGISGQPTLRLQIGSVTVHADYEPLLSTSSEIYFGYTILTGQTDTNGISIPANSLSLGLSSSILDQAGNAALLDHDLIPDNSSFSVDTIVIAPSIIAAGGSDQIVSATADDSYVQGSAEADAIITLYTGSIRLGTTTVKNGQWSYELTPDDLRVLGEGSGKSLTATATDLSGNVSDLSVSFLFSVDTLSTPRMSIGRVADRVIIEGNEYRSETPYITGATGHLIWSLVDNDDASLFSINSSTGIVTMVPRSFESPLDQNGDNTYRYSLKATDEQGNSTTKPITVTVLNSNNSPAGIVAIRGIAAQGEVLMAENNLSDLDGLGTITYQWSANGLPLAGATGSTLVLTQDHVGKIITLSASYIDGGNVAETVRSAATVPVANVNDTPTGTVTIHGASVQGQTLNVSTTLADVDGLTSQGLGAISYQWKADGMAISGATALSLLLDQGLVGKTISVTASYIDGGGTTESVTSNVTALVANVNDMPAGTITISGTIAQHQVLKIAQTISDQDGIADGGASAIAYQWKADGIPISGAADSSLLLTQDLVGKAISLTASFIDGGGTAESVTSAATTVVANVNDPAYGFVTISGTPIQGQTLTAANTLADLDGLGTIAYQWKANGTAIPGATASTLLLTQALVGKAISVTAAYTDGGGTAEAVTSAATTAVANINDSPTGIVSISGIPTQGQTLTAAITLADLDGLGTITYQWRANGTAISGATASTLLLTQALVGKAISVTAAYTDGGGTAEAVTSAATSAVANINDSPTGIVSISGTPTQGQTLTAANTLADLDGLGTIAYQWKANGTAIPGATASTILLTQALVGKAISVTATYTDGGGTAEAVTSAATTAVANINDTPSGTVSISGSAVPGQTLTAANTLADADGIGSITYQWRADGTAIAGATGSSLLLTQALVGKVISVTASYIDGSNTTESVTSAATSPVVNLELGLQLASDTGSSPTDRLTSNATITVSGVISGSAWQFSTNAGSSWSTGSGSSFLVPAGTYTTGQVRVRRNATASDVVSSFPGFTVDTTAPSALGLALAADTGSSNTDRVTNNANLLISGLESDASWQFSTNSGLSWSNGTGTTFSVAAGIYGIGKVRARQIDAAGNIGVAFNSFAGFTVDAVALAPTLNLSADTGRSTTDQLTNNPLLAVSGLEPSATWQYSTNSGATWSSGSGTSFAVAPGVYSTGQVQVRQSDLAGNTSAANSAMEAFTLDVTAPDTPALILATDSGSSNSDRLTNDPTLQISGLEENATWDFSLNSGSTWSKGSGNSFSVIAGSYGPGQVRVRQTDAAGNVSPVFTSFAAFIVDASDPALPALTLLADTGVSNTDRLTSNATLSISSLEVGATWHYSTDSGNTWFPGSGTSLLVAAAAYEDGQVQVRQMDAAGNLSEANTTFAAFTVDTSAPANAPILELEDDTGRSTTDRVTNDATVLVSAMEDNADWQFSTNSGINWSTGTGNSFDLPSGSYTAGQVRVRQSDAAGNTSPVLSTFAAFTVDTAAPAMPALTLSVDTGFSNIDRITANPNLLLSGLEANATWQFSNDGGNSWLDGSGTSFSLAEGAYATGQVQVRQTDLAGNLSEANASFEGFVVDLIAPVAPPKLALVADTGSSSSDRLTANRFLSISGLDKGASWQFSLNSGSTWTNGTGARFSVTAGAYTYGQVQVRQSDAAGNTSAALTSFAAFTVDSTPPTALVLSLAVDTGPSNTDRLTANPTITLSGLETNASWDYSIDGGNTWIRGSGTSFSLAEGSYATGQVRARQIDLAGNISGVRTTFEGFILDLTAPWTPSLALVADTGSSSTDRLTANRTLAISDLEAGARWEFSINSGSTWTSGTGNSFSVTDGSYTTGQVRVRQIDAAGNISPVLSTFAAFTVDSSAPAAPSLTLAADTGSSNTDRRTANPSISITGLETNSVWQSSRDGGQSWIDGTGTSFSLVDGAYTKGQVQARQIDAAGNVSDARTSFEGFVLDLTAPVAPSLDLAADTGRSNVDRYTRNRVLSIGGVEPGANWHFSTNSGATWTAGSASTFSVADGSYTDGQVRVRQSDAAGNTSLVFSAFAAFTIDATPPATPALTLAVDTGSSNVDRLTANPNLLLSGLEANATWQISTDGGSSWIDGTGTSYSVSPGTYVTGQVQLRQSDLAGNFSETNGSLEGFTVIDASPVTIALTLVADTGSSNSDRLTANRFLSVSGVEPGASWQFSTNSGTTWSNGSGSLFSVGAGTYAEGQVQARQIDAGGNTSAPLSSFAAFTVDITPPSSLVLNLVADTGRSSRDRITFNPNLSISGLEDGASWQFSLNSGATWTNGTGTTFAVGPGSYTTGRVRVRQIDAAGNSGASLTSFAAFTIDPTAPVVPTLALAADTGSSNSDRLTRNRSLAISGMEAGAIWQFSTNAGTTWTTGTGTTFSVTPGVYASGDVQVRQLDTAGNISAAIDGFAAFTVDTTAPRVPTLALAADTGLSSTDRLTNNPNLLIGGLEAGASWQFSTNAGSSWSNGSGNTFSVAPGAYTTGQVRVRQLDAAGNIGLALSSFAAFSVDTTAPIVNTITVGGSDSLLSAQLNDQQVSGSTTPGQSIVLLYGTNVLGSASANSSGLFSLSLTPANIQTIGQGSAQSLTFADPAGNLASTASPSFAIATLNASANRDLLTGTTGQSDTYTWQNLSQSLLSFYDTLSNYESIDRLSIASAPLNVSLTSSRFTLSALNATNLSALLSETAFPAATAAAFSVSGMSGTFLAINDNTPGFLHTADAILYLPSHVLSTSNPITIF